nr:hypothetical protein [Tanacetum cinerariifolium]
MTKVIKEEFEKLESLMINDVFLTCNTPLNIFNKEFNQMSRMDDDLFAYEVENSRIANIPCDSNNEDDSEQKIAHEAHDYMEYDPSDAKGDDEVELTDGETLDSNDNDEVATIFRIETNVFDFETPSCKAFKEFNYLLQINPDVLTKILKDSKLLKNIRTIRFMSETKTYHRYTKNHGLTLEYGLNPLWLGIVRAEKETLRNKAIMEGLINEDDESNNEGWKSKDNFENTNSNRNEWEYENKHKDDERQELCSNKTHELLAYKIRRFEMIKYSFRDDKEYIAIKEDEYDDLTSTSKDVCQVYQEIFHMIDEGWMVTRAE